MKIEIRTHQISKTSWAQEGLAAYLKKINGYNEVEFKQFKAESHLLRDIEPKDLVILCDENGKTPSSRELAKKMEQWRDSGKRKMIFIVGGPFGVDKDTKERANYTLSLSSMVMNQEVALITLFEQIFRSHTIINNHPYHND